MDDSWTAIERIARQLGVTDEALRKWRVRGVPRAWRLDIVEAAGGKLDQSAFDNPPGPRRFWPVDQERAA